MVETKGVLAMTPEEQAGLAEQLRAALATAM